MNSKIFYILLLVATVVACVAYTSAEVTEADVEVAAGENALQPDCPVQRTVRTLSGFMDRFISAGSNLFSSKSATSGEY